MDTVRHITQTLLILLIVSVGAARAQVPIAHHGSLTSSNGYTQAAIPSKASLSNHGPKQTPDVAALVLRAIQRSAFGDPNGFMSLKWDAWVAIFTFVLACATGFQGWLIMRGEKLTRKQANAAVMAADAAAASVRNMQENAERELRAYISIESAEIVAATSNGTIVEPPRRPSDGFKALAHLVFRNAGKTPAKELKIYGRIDHVAWPINPVSLRELPFASPLISSSVLGPSQISHKFEISEDPITSTQETSLSNGTTVLVIHGEAKYLDAFNKERWVKYRYFTGGPVGLRGTALSSHEDGNDLN